MVDGFHFPVMGGLFLELVGKAGGVEFRHNAAICVKVGVIPVTTEMFILKVVGQLPEFGVKVYDVVPVLEVLMVAGFQVPVIGGLLVELVGRTGGVELRHNGPMAVKVVVVCGVIVILI